MNLLFLVWQLLATPVAAVAPGHAPLTDTSKYAFPYSIKESPKFKWSAIEVKVESAYRDSVLNAFKKDYAFYFKDEYAKEKDYYRSFHFINIDGDALPDLVYEGWSGAEGNMVRLYVQRKGKWDMMLECRQAVLSLQYEGNRLSALVTFNAGCCAETVAFETHYKVSASLRPVVVLQRAILVYTAAGEKGYIEPDDFFEQPFYFKTVSNGYALRGTPELDDVNQISPEEVEHLKGNVITNYPKGAKGKAWAAKKDGEGRIWWLVEMDPQAKLRYSRFYDADKRATYYFGWMSSKYLEKMAP